MESFDQTHGVQTHVHRQQGPWKSQIQQTVHLKWPIPVAKTTFWTGQPKQAATEAVSPIESTARPPPAYIWTLWATRCARPMWRLTALWFSPLFSQPASIGQLTSPSLSTACFFLYTLVSFVLNFVSFSLKGHLMARNLLSYWLLWWKSDLS